MNKIRQPTYNKENNEWMHQLKVVSPTPHYLTPSFTITLHSSFSQSQTLSNLTKYVEKLSILLESL
jgi:hypothetical protein